MIDNWIRDSVAPRTTAGVTHLPSVLPPDLGSVLTLLKSTYGANLNPKPSEDFFLGYLCSINRDIQIISLATEEEAHHKYLPGNTRQLEPARALVFESALPNERADLRRLSNSRHTVDIRRYSLLQADDLQ
jgi:hypothetical protein